MKKFILVPDSFKGTLSALEVCKVMKTQILRFFPEAEVCSIPVADGGEGTTEAFLTAMGGKLVQLPVSGPFGETVEGFYGILLDGKTAVIEMAACAGLPMAKGRLDPSRATTYGVGQLMQDAVGKGCTKLVLGLGGSCTNDGGAGAAAAAGARFFRKDGSVFIPVGSSLEEVETVDLSELKKTFAKVEITVMCDVDSPLYGPKGAAYVFAPQKGADPAMVRQLDRALESFAQKVGGFPQAPGAGAAGGMGFGMASFFGAALKRGIDTVLDTVKFRELLKDAGLVFTGEGKLDSQSLCGKVLSGVGEQAKCSGVPVVALVGEIGEGAAAAYEKGISAVFSINRAPRSLEETAPYAAENLGLAMENLLRLLKLAWTEKGQM